MENGSRCHHRDGDYGSSVSVFRKRYAGGRRFGKQAEDGVHACGAVLWTEALAAVGGTNAVYT